MSQYPLDRSKDWQYLIIAIGAVLWAAFCPTPSFISLQEPTPIIPTAVPVFTCSSLKELYPDNYRANVAKCWLRFKRPLPLNGKTPYVYMLDADEIHAAWESAKAGSPVTSYKPIESTWSPSGYDYTNR